MFDVSIDNSDRRADAAHEVLLIRALFSTIFDRAIELETSR